MISNFIKNKKKIFGVLVVTMLLSSLPAVGVKAAVAYDAKPVKAVEMNASELTKSVLMNTVMPKKASAPLDLPIEDTEMTESAGIPTPANMFAATPLAEAPLTATPLAASPTPVTWAKVSTATKFSEDGVVLYTTEGAVTAGEISRDGTSPAIISDLVSDPTKGDPAGHYRIPSGWYVASGSTIMIMERQPEGLDGSWLDYYEYKNGNYEEMSSFTGLAATKITGDTTFGCTYKVTSIMVDYASPTSNSDGEEVAGTVFNKDSFIVTAELASGSSVRLSSAEFEISETKIPLSDIKNFELDVTYPIRNLRRPHTMKVTIYKVTDLQASCNKAYYANEIIEAKSITASVAKQDVLTGKTVTTVLKPSEFTFTPNMIQNDGNNIITVDYKGRKCNFILVGHGVDRLSVSYTGGEVVVGQDIDVSKLKVFLIFTDGTQKEIKKDYTLVSKTVSVTGENTLMLNYNQYSTTFKVTGVSRSVTKLTAKYAGTTLTAGSSFPNTDVIVTATYNDKTEERVYNFQVSSNKVEKIGDNKFTVTYQNMTATFSITGTEKMPSHITAIYTGGPIIEGNSIDKTSIQVNAFYSDGSYQTVTDFTVYPETLTSVGNMDVTVEYKKLKQNVYVLVTMKTITTLKAVYNGPEIEQGKSFSRDHVIVTATYNDNTTAQITDFTLVSTVVPQIGENTYNVIAQAAQASFKVTGIAKLVTGKGTMQADVSDDVFDGVILTTTVQGQIIRENLKLEVESHDHDEMKKFMRKSTKSNNYVCFDMTMDGYDFNENQYLTATIKVPSGFDPAKTAVFYAPNRKNVLVRLGGGLIDPNTYEFYAYRSGTYVIMECNKEVLKQADLRRDTNPNAFIIGSGIPAQMYVGEGKKFTARVLYGSEAQMNGGFDWTVDDKYVATMLSDGTFMAKDTGYVNLTITSKVDKKLTKTYSIEIIEREEDEEEED